MWLIDYLTVRVLSRLPLYSEPAQTTPKPPEWGGEGGSHFTILG